MDLGTLFINELNRISTLNIKKGFGWMIIYFGKNMLGGYKVLDYNILILFLILSPNGYVKALNDGFLRFEFGKTWAETEINGQKDLTRVIPYLSDAYNYIEKRNKLKAKKK